MEATKTKRKISAGSFQWPASTKIVIATVTLFAVSAILEPSSVSHGAIRGMLPFAAVLAIAAIGQTLVIQQGGIDLSVPGMISLTVVIMTHNPAGDASKLPEAILLSYGCAIAAGLISGIVVSRVGITAIVTTLGMNALLLGVNLQFSNGTISRTTEALQSFSEGYFLGIQTPVLIAVAITAIVGVAVKRTLVGRRFEAVGANSRAAKAAGLEPTRYAIGAYVAASILYCSAGIILAGIISSPSAFEGDTYLLPSVAAVVLGGTSLLGGRGSAAATAVGALFIQQLSAFVLSTGVNTAIQYLVQAAVLAAGIAVYSVPWADVRERLQGRRARGGGPPSGPELDSPGSAALDPS